MPAPHLRFEPHLTELIARAAVADHRIQRAEPRLRAELARVARRERARASVRLDASPLEDETADAVDAGERPAGPARTSPPAAAEPAGGWAAALKLEGMATQDVAALEYRNALAADALVDELAPEVLSDPRAVLTELHAAVCRDLVDPAVVGRLRRSSQAVHDGAQGAMIYSPPEPEVLPERFAELLSWLQGPSALLPPLVVAATAELRLLELSPFEAGNGRTARLLGRAVGVARGFDRYGLAVPEQAAVDDALAYHREIAATVRRRGDVTRWVERHAERVVPSLEAAAEALDPLPVVPATDHPEPLAEPSVSDPTGAAGVPLEADLRDGDTLADVARRAGVTLARARVLVDALLAQGALQQAPGTSGLRLLRREGHPGTGRSDEVDRA